MRAIPAALGYFMPAEWHPHSATWLSYPHNRETWEHNLTQVEDIYTQMVYHLHAGEMVNLLVNDAGIEQRVTQKLLAVSVDLTKVIFHQIPTVDAWMRDYGPTFLIADCGVISPKSEIHNPQWDTPTPETRKPKLAMVDWIFNGWGNKHPDYSNDTAIPRRINERLNVPRFEPGIVLEGGSIEVNGEGTVLTTEQCLLNPNRNPHLSREEIEGYLKDYLGVTHVIWLREGIIGDDTDGHVDHIARFVNPTTIVCAVEKDRQDENYEPLQENFRLLQSARDQDGNSFALVPLPMPGVASEGERRLPASYANFYIGKEVVLVPTFNHPNDAKALDILQRLFPTRRVVGTNCTALGYGCGAIHCVTQQQPQV